MTLKPWHGETTMDYDGTFDSAKVCIGGWEYSANGTDVNSSPTKPTHAVIWMRPTFVMIDKVPEGFVLVDAYEAWPEGMTQVVNEKGDVVKRPPRGTYVLAPLAKEFGS